MGREMGRDLAGELHDHRGDPDEWDEVATRVKVKAARSEVVSFRLPSEQLDRIERLAGDTGRSVSDVLRAIVAAHLQGQAHEPVVDILAGGSGRFRLSTRTTSGQTGYTAAEPADWIPDEPPATVTCLD